MKTVFSNSQLAHIWANQSQDSGRNSSNTMYFYGNEIYSYGSHYLIASNDILTNIGRGGDFKRLNDLVSMLIKNSSMEVPKQTKKEI